MKSLLKETVRQKQTAISKYIDVTFVPVIIVNSSIINKIMLFDPNVCLVVFYIFHVLTFVQLQTLHRFLESYTLTSA
ncbi:hypothetical protein Hanom_Chr13g01202441 [Helianthus anomalus]